MTIKIVTWNVNSLRVRLPHVLAWLDEHKPDIIALQETKLPDELFPANEIRAAGYEPVFSGQRTYNGMAILSREKAQAVLTEIPSLHDPQRRVLGVSLYGIRILDLYVPNGESVASEKYGYKLNWLTHLKQFVEEELKRHPKMILLGDFNIAPDNRDVHDPAAWENHVLCSEKEREALQSIARVGFKDCFRLFDQPEKVYSWWDYRMNAFKRNLGLRIDHIFASNALAPACQRCFIDKTPRTWDRPSDHAPVVAEFGI